MLLNEITNIDKLEMLKHELYVILISKKNINGKVYPHQWAEDICTVCFGYTKMVDNWLYNSKNMKKEIQRYENTCIRCINSIIIDIATDVDITVSTVNTAAIDANIVTNDANNNLLVAIDIAYWAGYWKAQSQALFNALHELIPQFKFDMFSAIDAIVNQKIQDNLNNVAK